MSYVQQAQSSSAKATGVAGASLTGVAANDGLVCFVVYTSVAGSLTLTDSSGTTWGLWTSVALTGATIAIFAPSSAVVSGTHTVTASFTGGGGAWTQLIEDTFGLYGNFGGQKLVAPGTGNSLVPGRRIGVSGNSIYQLAIDNTNNGINYQPANGAFSLGIISGSDTIGIWSIVNSLTLGGTNSGLTPGINDSTGADTYGVVSMAFATVGMSPALTHQTILIDEDVGPQQRTPYPLGMFFGRSVQTTQAVPLAYLSIKTPPWEFYRDPFTSVYPVIEVYAQNTQITPAPLFANLWRQTSRLDPPEEDLRRFDHQTYFQIQRRYTAQLVGYHVEVPDFNDHPWLEWVHPAASPESALFPYRRQIVPANPYQFPIMWGQPKPWPVTGEEDSVFRKPDVGVLLPFPRPTPPQILMPNLIGLDQATAIGIILNLGLLYVGSVFEDEIYWQIAPPTPWNPTGPFPPDTRGIVIGQWPLPGIPDSIDPVSGNPIPGSGFVQPGFTQVTLYLSSGKDFSPGTGNSSTGNVPNTVIGSTQFP